MSPQQVGERVALLLKMDEQLGVVDSCLHFRAISNNGGILQHPLNAIGRPAGEFVGLT